MINNNKSKTEKSVCLLIDFYTGLILQTLSKGSISPKPLKVYLLLLFVIISILVSIRNITYNKLANIKLFLIT